MFHYFVINYPCKFSDILNLNTSFLMCYGLRFGAGFVYFTDIIIYHYFDVINILYYFIFQLPYLYLTRCQSNPL